uniref:tRNA (guanine-N(7)-)-methyltransferase non-catalytic subunit wdr4 n=1 Tax=Pristiophorus japonicus TaxID=55135 RepID=UPI00398E58C3
MLLRISGRMLGAADLWEQELDHTAFAYRGGAPRISPISHPISSSLSPRPLLTKGVIALLSPQAVSPDDRFVITADRDEKIRVSLLEQPFVIEAFCLGHREFVSALFCPPNHPRLLVSGSGDGTVRLWDYENGKELHCFQLSDGCQQARCAVVRMAHCRQGDFFAVVCDGFSSVRILELDVEAVRLVERQMIAVKRRAWDVVFDDCAGLWILDGDVAVVYRLHEGQWQNIPDHPEQMRIEEVIRANWPVFQGSAAEINYSNLYKMSIDTMTEYRLKKEQRMNQRQNKREWEMGKVTGDCKRMRVGEAAM